MNTQPKIITIHDGKLIYYRVEIGKRAYLFWELTDAQRKAGR